MHHASDASTSSSDEKHAADPHTHNNNDMLSPLTIPANTAGDSFEFTVSAITPVRYDMDEEDVRRTPTPSFHETEEVAVS